MEESKIIEMIKNNPNIISTVKNPTEEMKKLAVSKNGLVLEYIKNPTREIEELALENNIRAIKYIENPTEEMMIKAISIIVLIGFLIKNKSKKINNQEEYDDMVA